MHSGTSTGPRTAKGLARSRRARWKHGLYSAEALAEQRRVGELLIQSRELLKQMQAGYTGELHGAWGSSRSLLEKTGEREVGARVAANRERDRAGR
jgi:hypothetical protein